MSKIPVKTIAVLQVIGGVGAIVFTPWTQIPNIFSVPIVAIELLIDLLAVVAGIALWCETSFGRKASLVIQTIQLPKIMVAPIIFMFSFGLDVWVHASAAGVVGIQFTIFNNQFFLNVNPPGTLGISITSIIALVILKKYQPEPRTADLLPPPPPPNDWPDERAPNDIASLDRSAESVK